MLPMFLQHGGAEQPTAAVVHLSIMMWRYVSMGWCGGDVFIHVDVCFFCYGGVCSHSWWCCAVFIQDVVVYVFMLVAAVYLLFMLWCSVCVFMLLLWLIYSSWVWLFVHVVIHLFIFFAVYSCMSGGVIFHGRSDGKIIHIWCSGEWNYTVF